MKNQKKHIIFFFLILAQTILAQQANFWAFKDFNGIDFNSDSIVNVSTNFTVKKYFFKNYLGGGGKTISSFSSYTLSDASICDKYGKLLFYTNGVGLWDKYHNLVDTNLALNRDKSFLLNGDWQSDMNVNQRNKIQVCQINDSLYYLFNLFRNNEFPPPEKYYLNTKLKLCIVRIEQGIPIVEVHDSTVCIGSYINIAHIKINEGTHWLVLRDSCKYLSYEIKYNSILLRNTTFLIESNSAAYQGGASMIFSNKKENLFVGYNSHSLSNYYDNEYNIFKYNFDITNGAVSNRTIIEHTVTSSSAKTIYALATSPNDEILYVSSATYNSNAGSGVYFIEQKKIINNIVQTEIIYTSQVLNYCINDFQLSYNGKLYVRYENGELGEISKPDSFPATKYLRKIPGFLHYSGSLTVPSRTISLFPGLDYEYHKIGFMQNTEDCRNSYLQNLCDTSFFKHYCWIVDNTDTFLTTDLDLSRFSKGSHFIKLRAFNINEFASWYSGSIYIIAAPKASFGFDTKEGCQHVAFTISDSSNADSISSMGCSYHYYFGDGTDTLINSKYLIPGLKINHSYSQSGLYTVRLIFSNGFCTDTLERINEVIIKPAPAPRFSYSTNRYCLPLSLHLNDTIKTYVLEKKYIFNDNQYITTQNNQNFDTILKLATDTIFKIKILITGVTGCITTDSITLYFKPGILLTDFPEVIYTTVINPNQTLTTWNKIPNAISYNFIANGKTVNTTDTFYIDNTSTTTINSYSVLAFDQCKEKSLSSRVNNPIVVSAENININSFALLTFSPYNYWKKGVQKYAIQKQDPLTNNFTDIAYNDSTQLTYADNLFAAGSTENILQVQTCYRILATDGISTSLSNIACTNIKPTFFIPNSFSPNGDGLNDYFKPYGLGITNYKLTIYDRWGKLVFTGTEADKGWDGMEYEQGAYVYFIEAVSGNANSQGKNFNAKGTVILVR
jgi:gliding motility-associated-like protein